MKRRNLLKGAIIGGIVATTTGRAVLAGMTPKLTGVTAATLSGAEAQLSKSTVTGLASSMSGPVLQAQSDGYDAARTLWNTMIDHRPALIAQPTSAEDVAVAVRFGREHDLLTSVHCGGHNFSGKSVAKNGLMIDLSFMNKVDVDAKAKIAHTQGGARLGHVDLACLPHNLITMVGTDADTGAGGLTLGGGLGRLDRKLGLTIDNLLAAEIVTADGEIHEVSATREPDLFWAIRGGGGNFGVATRFDYQLHDFNPTIYGGEIWFPWSKRRALLELVAEMAPSIDDEMHLAPTLLMHPEQGPVVGVEAVYIGDHKTGAKLLEPISRFAKPLNEGFGPTPYIDLQMTSFPAGQSHYIKSGLVKTLSSDVIDVLVENFPMLPGMLVFFQHMGGAVARVGPQETAFTHRDALYNIGTASSFWDPADFQKYRTAIRTYYAKLEPHTLGFYANLMEKDEGQTLDNYAVNLARLQKIKAVYDPDNFFRLNANIKPAT